MLHGLELRDANVQFEVVEALEEQIFLCHE